MGPGVRVRGNDHVYDVAMEVEKIYSVSDIVKEGEEGKEDSPR